MSGTRRHHGYRSQLADGRMCPSGRARTAFSMAELMVAIGILGIGIVIIAGAFPVAIDQSREAMELSTSQMVFNEAVNQLKTRFTWTELEAIMDPNNPQHRLSQNGSRHFVWLIDAGTISDTNVAINRTNKEYDTDGDPSTNPILTYSSDSTYAWLATVQGTGIPRCYKFNIFVVREPTGVLTADEHSKVGFRILRQGSNQLAPSPASGQVTSRLDFYDGLAPPRGTTFVANNAKLFKILDQGEPNYMKRVTVQCDKPVSDGLRDRPPTTKDLSDPALYNVNTVAYPYGSQGITRKVPTLAVYQTVISY